MSEKKALGLIATEKILGLIILIIGAILTYYTQTSPEAAKLLTGFFTFTGITLIILGTIMIIAKTKE